MPGFGAQIHECRVIDVDETNRRLDALSRDGRPFSKVPWTVPYTGQRGGGFDFVPVNGDTCLILSDQSGFTIVIGFKVAVGTPGPGVEAGDRATGLGQGTQLMRAVSEGGIESLVAVYRGGVTVIGSGSMAVTTYAASSGTIRHLFDNFQMVSQMGHVDWSRKQGTQKGYYEADIRTVADAEEGGFRVKVRIGVDGYDPVQIFVERAEDDPFPCLVLSVDSDGRAHLKANILDIDVLSTLNIKAALITINDRPVLPLKDPI